MHISPFELAKRLGIEIDLDPACVGTPLWTGQKLHISFITDYSEECDDTQCRINHLSDVDFFHEIAHILLCDWKYLIKPNFGFDWGPKTGYGTDNSYRSQDGCSQQDQDQEEHEADTLGDLLAFYCGVSQEILISLMNDLEILDEKYEAKLPMLYPNNWAKIQELMPFPRMERKIQAGLSKRFWQTCQDFLTLMGE